MSRIIEYPSVSELNNTYSMLLDSESYGTKTIPVTSLLSALLGLGSDYLPNSMLATRSISELEVPGSSSYSAAKASPMSVYYVTSTAVAAAFDDLPVIDGAKRAGILFTIGASADRTVQFFIRSTSNLETIFYRNNRSGYSAWGTLGQRNEIPEVNTPTFSSGFYAMGGGFYKEGKRCFVEMAIGNQSNLSSATEINLASNFPVPAISYGTGRPLSAMALTPNSAPGYKKIGGVIIRDHWLVLLTDAAIPAESVISVSGSYYFQE